MGLGILLVEDDPGDQELARRALSHTDGARLHVVSDGQEAMEYLFRTGRYADGKRAQRPDLILLDLNLPGIDGKKVLEAAKGDKELRNTPVVVLTTSAQDRDIEESYRLGCNSYVIKPIGAKRFIATLRDVYRYWSELVALPERRA